MFSFIAMYFVRKRCIQIHWPGKMLKWIATSSFQMTCYIIVGQLVQLKVSWKFVDSLEENVIVRGEVQYLGNIVLTRSGPACYGIKSGSTIKSNQCSISLSKVLYEWLRSQEMR